MAEQLIVDFRRERESGLTQDPISRSTRGVYAISVTSELSGIAPQTLRLYERRGLLTPSRSDGGTRRYSDDDLERLKRITELVEQGVNLAGVAQVLDLQTKHGQLESDYTALALRNAELTADRMAAQRRRAAPKKAKKDSPQHDRAAATARAHQPRSPVCRLPEELVGAECRWASRGCHPDASRAAPTSAWCTPGSL